MKIPRQAPSTRTVGLPLQLEQDVGLGDVVKKATGAVGIKPCGACLRRAEWLNERVIFTSRHGRPSPG